MDELKKTEETTSPVLEQFKMEQTKKKKAKESVENKVEVKETKEVKEVEKTEEVSETKIPEVSKEVEKPKTRAKGEVILVKPHHIVVKDKNGNGIKIVGVFNVKVGDVFEF